MNCWPGDGGESSENPLKALKILYANAQGIVGKIGELTAVVQDIEPDLILLTETWCNSTIPDAFLTLEGYRLETDLRRDRTDTRNGIGGGLLVYA
jgi:hypothetical protein